MVKTKLKFSRRKPSTYLRKRSTPTLRSTPAKRLKTFAPKRSHPISTVKKSSKKLANLTELQEPSQTKQKACRKTLFTDKSCDFYTNNDDNVVADDDYDVDDDEHPGLIKQFLDTQTLLEENQLGDFFAKLCTAMTSGALPLDNICFRLFVDLINFLSSRDARCFRYQQETLTWWYVLLKQHGEQILRTCGGLKFLGRTLEPSSAQVNFIVPTASVLRKLKPTKLDVSQPRKPGVFHDVLEVINTDSNIC